MNPYPLNNVDPNEIELLTPLQLVKLLNQLLLNEAGANMIRTPGIHVPFQITVPDGGKDAEWNCAEWIPNDFIPHPQTYYQCKASDMTDTALLNEVAIKKPKTDIYIPKPRVKERLETGGAYVFFTSKTNIAREREKELDNKIRERATKSGIKIHSESIIKILDCNHISNWVNKFPTTISYIKSIVHNFQDFQYDTYEKWKELVEQEGRYFINPSFSSRIEDVQKAILDDDKPIRILGLSGVGKTRFACELFSREYQKEQTIQALSSTVIYIDNKGDDSDTLSFVKRLVNANYSAIVVVDDCMLTLHRDLEKRTTGSQIKLLTIYHEYEDKAYTESTHVFEIHPQDNKDILKNILKQSNSLKVLTDEKLDIITEYTHGFPIIARIIAEFERAPTVEDLQSKDNFFYKLLSQGRKPDSETLLVMRALSLFKVIGTSPGKLDEDRKHIREYFCESVSTLRFNEIIRQQEKRRIIQRIADTIRITPRPLAVALAADFIPVFTDDWEPVLNKIEEFNLLTFFIKRFEELEFLEENKGKEIGEWLIKKGLPFQKAEYLLSGRAASEVFRILCTLCPQDSLDVAQNALGNLTRDELLKVKGIRSSLTRGLQTLAWNEETFAPAATLLLKFAAAENETWSNNSTGTFVQLFKLYLSGTKLPAIKRLSVINNALTKKDKETRLVAIKALGAALENRNFSRGCNKTLTGNNDPNLDWAPNEYSEIFEYWRKVFNLLSTHILSRKDTSDFAKKTLGENLDSILSSPLLFELEDRMKEISSMTGSYWAEARDSIKLKLTYANKEETTAISKLDEWLSIVTPEINEIPQSLKDIISKPGFHFEKSDSGKHTDLSQQNAIELAGKYSLEKINLIPYLEDLLLGEQQQAWIFGSVLGKKDTRALELINSSLKLWQTIDKHKGNNSFICGLFNGYTSHSDGSNILDYIKENSEIIDLLVSLTQSHSNLKESDLNRIFDAIEKGNLPPAELSKLVNGVPLSVLPKEYINEAFKAIISKSKKTTPYIFEILHLITWRDEGKFNYYSSLFKEIISSPYLDLSVGQSSPWSWKGTATALLNQGNDSDWEKRLFEYIISSSNLRMWGRTEDYFKEVLALLIRKSNGVGLEALGALKKYNESEESYFVLRLLCRGSNHLCDDSNENQHVPLWEIPLSILEGWINKNSSFVKPLLSSLQLFTTTKENDRIIFEWHPTTLCLLDHCDDSDSIVRSISPNLLGTFGSTGSRIPYYRRRIDLIKKLDSSNNPILDEAKDRLVKEGEKYIKREQSEEDNYNAYYQ